MSAKSVPWRETAQEMQVRCPLCNHWQGLDEIFSIDGDNNVYPDFVCLYRGKGGYCTFSGSIKLGKQEPP